MLYMDLAELEKSKDFHHRALQIRIKVLGGNHCKVGDCMLNLGLVHERCSEYDVAASHFQQALDVYAGVYPTSHMLYKSAVEGLKRFSDCDCMLNLRFAASHFQQSLDVYAGVYPKSHMLFKSAVEDLKRDPDEVETLHSHHGCVESVYSMTNPRSSSRFAANQADYRVKRAVGTSGRCCVIL